MMNRKTNALIRAGAALLGAVILLAVTGFAFVDMLSAPVTVVEGDELQENTYVQTDLIFVMDMVGVERSGNKEIAYYAVAPVGNTFALVRFPAVDKASAESMIEATGLYLQGETSVMEFFMSVSGKVEALQATEAELLNAWFSANQPWMTASGVIGEMEDYSSYLSPYVLRVGEVGSMSYGPALALTTLALLLAVYAVAELVLVAAGVHNKKAAPKAKTVKEAPKAVPAVTEIPVGPAEEAPAEAESAETEPAAEEAPEESFVDESFFVEDGEEGNDDA